MITPLISVIMTVYNGEAYLAEAVESVLSQQGVAFELIVIDDGSTDGSAKMLDAYGGQLTVRHQPNRGQDAARNYGLSLAQGGLIAFIDADDIWLPEKLAVQSALMQQQAQVDMVFSHMQNFHSPELGEARRRELPGDGQILPGYSSGTLLALRTSFDKAGVFPEQRRIGGFIDWYSRAQDAGLVSHMLPQVLMRRRLHNSNVGVVAKDRRSEYLHVLKAALDRRRKAAT